MEKQLLRPVHDNIEIQGKMSYDSGAQGWNTLRFKKALLHQFPQLNEKRSHFSYKIVLFESYKLIEKALKEMQKKDEPMPLFLFFYKEPDTEQS